MSTVALSAPETIYLRDYRVPDYLIDQIVLEFNIEEASTTVTALSNINVNPSSKSRAPHLRLQGESLKLLTVKLNDRILTSQDYQQTADELIIFNVPQEVFTLEIQTRIFPQQNTALSGLYQSSGNLCTQCEPHGFRRITYYLDRPDVMARFKTTIIADEKRYPIALSNGNCIGSKKLADGKYAVTWEDPFKKPSYLFALVAGDFEWLEDFFITQSGRRITLRIYVEKGNQDKIAHAMQAVKKAMRWDEEHYNREYDLDIFMIVAVSDFNMGAMENKGLNIFNTQYILAKPETATDTDYIHIESVIAHEYFHNWTGNRITCRDWFQLSLKEGLTIFRDQSFTADTTSQTVARIHDVNYLRTVQFLEDAGPLAHSVQPDSYIEINNFYTATVYNKGAELIRMLKVLLGEKRFHQGMEYYFSHYDGQAVTIEEFIGSMEAANQVDLTQFRVWYKQAGTPVLDVSDQYDAVAQRYTLHIHQSCPLTPGQSTKMPLHMPVQMGLLDEGTGKEITQKLLELKEAQHTFYFDTVPAKPVLSLLRGFSAPVKVNYKMSPENRLFLFKQDTDWFNRWEAGQNYATHWILQAVRSDSQPLAVEYIDAIKGILHDKQLDPFLLAELIRLPGENYLAEQMTVVDVEGIHRERERVLFELATALKNDFSALYQQRHDQNSSQNFSLLAAGKREIKNLALSYLNTLNHIDVHDRIVKQFHQSYKNNMTDAMAALHCIANSLLPGRMESLQLFYEYWRHDALVIDKWFALQASSKLSDTLSVVKQLMHHPAFDLKNPNKVYSLIGTLAHRNPVCFHAADGAGYQFLTDCVLALDPLNPQVAARMIKPFSQWGRYDEKRQALIQQQLETILLWPNLSKDVKEIVIKSLGEN